LEKNKQKIIEFKDVSPSNDFLFQICNRLKMKGWQFDKLTIEEKVSKWLSRNPKKELILEIYSESILKKIKEFKSRIPYETEIPKGYELGNPHNRWIHNNPISRTQEQIIEDQKKIDIETDEEYRKVKSILNSLKRKCQIEIIEK